MISQVELSKASTFDPQVPLGYDAFRPEYTPKVNPNSLRKDIESYLGEYRFQVQKYEYELLFGVAEDGEIHLLPIDDREPMVAKAQRAIERRLAEGKNIDREEAELKGLMELDRRLKNAGVGDKVIWMSPPGPELDGYGDYGFVFLGTVDQINPYTREKHLSMTAVRVEQPTIDQFNSALTFLTGHEVKIDKAENFLADPIVATNFWDEPENVLVYSFNLTTINHSDALFKEIVPLLKPQIDEFINLVSQGQPKALLLKAIQAIEMYALDLKHKLLEAELTTSLQPTGVSLQQMIIHYQDRTPPVVAGSCGSTVSSSSGIQTSNILNKFSTLNDLFSSGGNHEENSCGQCGKENDGHYHCPNCNKAYADENQVPQDQRTKVCNGSLPDGQLCNFKFNC
ncbi:hypothetical protein HY612_04805 [Candidatus Roizmanbacteria bacterium]|nr:hypothetical protein [Candidatus Roizmanbacteria bacterium]